MKYYCSLLLLCLFCCSLYAQERRPADTLEKKKPVLLDSLTVISNGYQVLSKDRSTGSYNQVDNKTLNLQTGSNILARLESVTSSLAVSKKNSLIPAIAVRGLSTINGSTAPLIILDNFPYEGDINAINPNMVESITVLKDATAASIWGTRAGNGVIVITTKKGRLNQPFTIEYSSTLQVSKLPDLYYLRPIATSDYIDAEQLLYSKGYFNSNISSSAHPVLSPVLEILDKQSRGLITATDAGSRINSLRSVDVRDEMLNSVYTNTINQQYSLGFSGGDNRSSWSAAGGYDRNRSELDELFTRKNFRIENSYRVVKNLRFTGNINYTVMDARSGKDGYVNQDYLHPYSSLADANGNALPVAKNYRMAYTDTLGGGRLLDWNFYPATNYQHSYTISRTSEIISNAGLHYQLIPSLSVEAKYQYEDQHIQRRFLMDEASYQARYYVNLYSQINYSTGAVTNIVPKGAILDITNSDTKANNYRAQLNFNKKWNQFEVVALAGNEVREVRTSAETYRTYGYNTETAVGTITDTKNRYPIITTGSQSTIPLGENTFSEQLRRFVSWYGNLSVNYNRQYQFNLSGRRDASNLFGVNTNQKWTPLWSAGLGWQVSNAGFYHLKALPVLKLRATYGYTGNADPNRAGVVTLIANGNSTTTGLPAYRTFQFPNPNLRWEQVAISNVGIDFTSAGNRISGSVEWYQKKGVDLFGNSPVDITAGLGSATVIRNVATMKSKGWDISLNSINTNGKLRWTTNLVFSYNAEKVVKAYPANTNASFYVNDGNAITSLEGYPVHAIISYHFAGLDHNTGVPLGYLNGASSSNYAALTGSGITLGDLAFSGAAIPQVFGSVTNTISWKKLEFNFNLSYKFHYFFKRKALNYVELFGTDKKSTADFSRRWQNPGDELLTDVPSFIYPLDATKEAFYSGSSTLVEKGDHIRLQFINLSYRFDLRNRQQAPVGKLQVFLNASNLGIIWRANKKGIDPDYAISAIPTPAMFAAGVKIILQ